MATAGNNIAVFVSGTGRTLEYLYKYSQLHSTFSIKIVGYDRGPIVLQKELDINPHWDATELAKQVFELEKIAYPEAIEKCIIENARRK